MPLYLKAKMGRSIFMAKAADRADPVLRGNPEARKDSPREWDQSPASDWVRRLVPKVNTFVATPGPSVAAEYYSMQLMSGHGCFQKFRFRIGKAPAASCLECGAALDDAEHVLVSCPAYDTEREVLAAALGVPVEVNSLIGTATASSEKWQAFLQFATSVMTDRQTKERDADRALRIARAEAACLAAAQKALDRRCLARKRKRQGVD